MPKIQIDLPKETNEKLKELAKKDFRSLSNFITVTLINLANNPSSILQSQQAPFATAATTSTTASTAASASTLTLEQLQAAGIKDLKLNKPEKELTPEEQSLRQQKLNLQQDKILQQREKKWFKRAQEVMAEYWDDNACQYFAHKHIYGDALYHKYPDDPNATTPEPDDSRIDEFLQYEKSLYDEPDEEEEISDEPTNDIYQRIKSYYMSYLNKEDFEDLVCNARSHALDYIKDYHQVNIFKGLGIPLTQTLSDTDWNEILDSFN